MWNTRPTLTCGLLLAVCLLLPLAGCGSPAGSTETDQATSVARASDERAARGSTGSGVATAARTQAAAAGKYLFVFFWKADDDSSAAMRERFEQTMAGLSDRADAVAVNITDPAEQAIVDEYGLGRAPMPLVLAIAPNGAITGGFPTQFSEADLLSAFVSPVMQQCMKLLQDGKLVLLCVQGAQTELNDEAMQGVKDFAADPRFGEATQIVRLDPADGAEKLFLDDLELDPAIKTAVTVFLVPPGAPIAMFEGATSKDALVAALQRAASSSCCPGGACGPGGAPQ